jgi:hypothetical protein
MSDAFERRRKSFEAEYFGRKDAELVDKLKAVFHRAIDREGVRKATRIQNDRLLDNLVALNLSGDLMAAFNLLPLVELAWADGAVDDREVRAIMTAAEKQGLVPDSRALTMIEFALRHGPNPEAREIWYLYANELKSTLTAKELAEFREDLLEHARTIASISGGFLNVAFTISPNEKRVLEQIERALTV